MLPKSTLITKLLRRLESITQKTGHTAPSMMKARYPK
jgi:hypothetical protein